MDESAARLKTFDLLANARFGYAVYARIAQLTQVGKQKNTTYITVAESELHGIGYRDGPPRQRSILSR